MHNISSLILDYQGTLSVAAVTASLFNIQSAVTNALNTLTTTTNDGYSFNRALLKMNYNDWIFYLCLVYFWKKYYFHFYIFFIKLLLILFSFLFYPQFILFNSCFYIRWQVWCVSKYSNSRFQQYWRQRSSHQS